MLMTYNFFQYWVSVALIVVAMEHKPEEKKV